VQQDDKGWAMELFALTRNPIPSGAVVGTFPGFDGKPMRYARFEATRGPKRGTVCLLTGFTEFIEKYFEMIADLRRRGFAVAAMDWRGQGGSWRAVTAQSRGHIFSFAEYENDLAAFMREIVLPDCPPPYVAFGHSMGGHVLLRSASRPGSWFERLVLTSPMVALTRPQLGMPAPLARTLVEGLCLAGLHTRAVPGVKDWRESSVEVAMNRLTSDRERYSRNRALVEGAPHLTVGVPTLGWLRAAMRSMAMMADPAFPRRISVPALFFIAGKDVIVEPSAIEDFSARMKSGTHVILANARHEICQEEDAIRGRFWAAFDAYLDIGQTV
jgi:lysophospholipase